jgi:hypothetical protein
MGFNVLKKNLNNVVGKENFILVWNIYKIHLEKKKKKNCRGIIRPLSFKTLVIKVKILRCCKIFATKFYP